MESQVYQQDCNLFMPTLPQNYVDLIITSPPYYNVRDYANWDSYEDFLEFLRETFTNAYRILKEGRMCVVNLSTSIIPRESRSKESKRVPLPFHFVSLMESIGFKFLEDIVWVKPDGAVANRNGGFYTHRNPVAYKPNTVTEYILVFQKPSEYLLDKVIKGYSEDVRNASSVPNGYERTNVWRINPENGIKDHPAAYPLAIPLNVVRYYSYVGDLVYDPFMGSGSTAVACEKLCRKWIGTEIHSSYVELLNSRLLKMI